MVRALAGLALIGLSASIKHATRSLHPVEMDGRRSGYNRGYDWGESGKSCGGALRNALQTDPFKDAAYRYSGDDAKAFMAAFRDGVQDGCRRGIQNFKDGWSSKDW